MKRFKTWGLSQNSSRPKVMEKNFFLLPIFDAIKLKNC